MFIPTSLLKSLTGEVFVAFRTNAVYSDSAIAMHVEDVLGGIWPLELIAIFNSFGVRFAHLGRLACIAISALAAGSLLCAVVEVSSATAGRNAWIDPA